MLLLPSLLRGPENMSNCINLVCIELSFDWIVPGLEIVERDGKKASTSPRGNHPGRFMKLSCTNNRLGLSIVSWYVWWCASFSENMSSNSPTQSNAGLASIHHFCSFPSKKMRFLLLLKSSKKILFSLSNIWN